MILRNMFALSYEDVRTIFVTTRGLFVVLSIVLVIDSYRNWSHIAKKKK